MENLLRAELIAWLSSDPALASLNAITEESPNAASPPWLGISASASRDWGSKDRPGRELRIALELENRADSPSANAPLIAAVEHRISTLPRLHDGFEVAGIRFLRARSERRRNNRRGVLLEYRFRLFHPQPE